MTREALDAAKTRHLRWSILVVVERCRPEPVPASLIGAVLNEQALSTAARDLHRDLDYLRLHGLILLEERPTGVIVATMTAAGVNVVEYTIDCPPGIGRPKRHDRDA